MRSGIEIMLDSAVLAWMAWEQAEVDQIGLFRLRLSQIRRPGERRPCRRTLGGGDSPQLIGARDASRVQERLWALGYFDGGITDGGVWGRGHGPL